MARKKQLTFDKDKEKFVDFLNFKFDGKSLGTRTKGQTQKGLKLKL